MTKHDRPRKVTVKVATSYADLQKNLKETVEDISLIQSISSKILSDFVLDEAIRQARTSISKNGLAMIINTHEDHRAAALVELKASLISKQATLDEEIKRLKHFYSELP